MGGEAALGVVGVLVAAVGWGSNFIVTKQYDLKDGFAFQFWMNCGILFLGLVTLFFAEHGTSAELRPIFSILGMVGGMAWATANLCTVQIIKGCGLGVGLATWSGVSLVTSFVAGCFKICLGPSCVEPKPMATPWMGIAGCVLSVASLVLFSFVRPELAPKDAAAKPTEESQLLATEDGPSRRRWPSFVMAIFAGILYGFQFLPASVYNDVHPDRQGLLGNVRLLFSQYCGQFMVSFVAYGSYSLYHWFTGKPIAEVATDAMMPSMYSGMLWAVAGAGAMLASTSLGLSVGFPLTMNGSFLINSFWAIFVFREVRGSRNIWLYTGAAACAIVGSVLITLSKPPQ